MHGLHCMALAWADITSVPRSEFQDSYLYAIIGNPISTGSFYLISMANRSVDDVYGDVKLSNLKTEDLVGFVRERDFLRGRMR